MKKAPRRRSPSKPAAKKNAGSAHLLGVGLDNEDGHKRITRADKFTIVGGSEETHGRATETFIKTFEELKHRGKHLETVEPKELFDIIHKSRPN